MSAVGEARQRAAAPWRAALLRVVAWPGSVLHWLLRVGLVLVVVALLGVSALAWRLSQGPIDVSWLARRIEAAVLPADEAADGSARLSIGAASLAWNGFQGGDDGLELQLRDLSLVEKQGPVLARVAEADVTVSLPRLLALQVAPRQVALSGVRLGAVRAADGAVALNLGGLSDVGTADPASGADLADVLAELRRPARNDGRGSGIAALSQLQQVRVRDAVVMVLDAASGTQMRAEVASLALQRQGGGGVQGEASGTLALGAATASLRLTAGLLADGGTHLELRLAPVQAAALAGSSPALAPIGMVDAAIEGRATLDLSPTLRPRSGEVHATTGKAAVSVGGGRAAFERLALDAVAEWVGTDEGATWWPSRVALRRAQAVLPAPGGGWPTTLGAQGDVVRQQGMLTGRFELTLDHAAFADLPALWPAAWGGHVRPWLTENVTGGTARDGAFTVTVVAPVDQFGDAQIEQAGGTLQGDDVTIHWLRPVPPIEHARALLTVVNPDVIDVAVPSAAQGGIGLRDGLLHFTGLAGRDQFLALTAGIQGQVPEVLQLLRLPRLQLLDKHPLPIKSSAGSLVGKLAVQLPMKDHLEFEQVGIQAQGHLARLHLGGLVAGRDLDRGDIQFDVSQDGLKASGTAAVASVAGAVAVAMDFRSGPASQVTQQASLVGRATAAQLAAAGIDAGGLITGGSVGVDVRYETQRGGAGHVAVKADLAQAGVALLGWRKAPGPAAAISASVLLEHDTLAGLDDIEANGPGMRVSARLRLVDGRPLLLELERLLLGPTLASGQVRFPEREGAPIRVRISGPTLDISTQLQGGGAGGQKGGAFGSPFIADLRFERVILGPGRMMAGVSAHADYDGSRLRALEANSTGPERLQAAIVPDGSGRRLSVRAADAGAVLRLLDVVDTVHGGALAVEARFDDRYAEPPLSGTLDVSEFGVRDAVILGKLLQAITIYGIFDAIRGQGVQFSRLIMPFTLNQTVLQIGEARAYSSSLGLTAQGWVDFGRHNIDLRGTVVPAYALNTALGRIPLVGRLFSPEKGGGLVAVNYSITGKSADPAIGVNPLSALTPGFLRGLFSIFD